MRQKQKTTKIRNPDDPLKQLDNLNSMLDSIHVPHGEGVKI